MMRRLAGDPRGDLQMPPEHLPALRPQATELDLLTGTEQLISSIRLLVDKKNYSDAMQTTDASMTS
jgi:hypothetical protein